MEEFTLSAKSKGKYSEKGSTFSALAIPVSEVVEVKKITPIKRTISRCEPYLLWLPYKRE